MKACGLHSGQMKATRSSLSLAAGCKYFALAGPGKDSPPFRCAGQLWVHKRLMIKYYFRSLLPLHPTGEEILLAASPTPIFCKWSMVIWSLIPKYLVPFIALICLPKPMLLKGYTLLQGLVTLLLNKEWLDTRKVICPQPFTRQVCAWWPQSTPCEAPPHDQLYSEILYSHPCHQDNCEISSLHHDFD